MKIIRQSGLPVVVDQFKSYQNEFMEEYDKIVAESGTDMPTVQQRCQELEQRLNDKYPKDLRASMPRGIKSWEQLVDKYGAPILVARSQEPGNPLVLVIMDEVTSK